VGNASHGVDQNVTLPQREDSFSVLAKVTVPLYRSGTDYSKSRAAIQTENQRHEELDDALNKSVETATTGWQTLMTAREGISVNKDAVNATDKALYGVREEAKVGTRTTLDVLNAEQELLNARLTLAKAEHDEKLAMLQLKASVGDLTAQSLHLPVEQLYDPKEHYDAVRNKWIGFGS
jgi:outer membrane protein